jgi:hypothetical protein
LTDLGDAGVVDLDFIVDLIDGPRPTRWERADQRYRKGEPTGTEQPQLHPSLSCHGKSFAH